MKAAVDGPSPAGAGCARWRSAENGPSGENALCCCIRPRWVVPRLQFHDAIPSIYRRSRN